MNSRPTDWRFSSWVPALQELMTVEVAMRRRWNLQRYKARRDPADDDVEAAAVRDADEFAAPTTDAELQIVDEVLRLSERHKSIGDCIALGASALHVT
eukprot:2546219-Pyramimonas_sp.AAC.1